MQEWNPNMITAYEAFKGNHSIIPSWNVIPKQVQNRRGLAFWECFDRLVDVWFDQLGSKAEKKMLEEVEAPKTAIVDLLKLEEAGKVQMKILWDKLGSVDGFPARSRHESSTCPWNSVVAKIKERTK